MDSSHYRPDAKPRRWRPILDTVATLAMLTASIVVVWVALSRCSPGRRAESEPGFIPHAPVSLEGAAVKGAANANVAVIEYSDFVCPFSGTFARDTLPELAWTYIDTGRVLLAFRHLPLEKIHPTAMRAAQAVECAGDVSKFWEMHDHLFAGPQQLETPSLSQYAQNLGVHTARFTDCLDGGQKIAKIRKDAADALSLQITKTPTFLLGTVEANGRVRVARRVSGARPYSAFDEILKQLLRLTGGAD